MFRSCFHFRLTALSNAFPGDDASSLCAPPLLWPAFRIVRKSAPDLKYAHTAFVLFHQPLEDDVYQAFYTPFLIKIIRTAVVSGFGIHTMDP